MPEGSWFIDADSGDIWHWSSDYDDDEAFDPEQRRDARRIEPLPSRVGYGDMEDFVESVDDPRAADLLARAIAGRGAFRRFKDVRVESGAFGQRRALIDAIGGVLAAQVPDEWTMATGPASSGLDQAREQFRRALLLEVPKDFVRVTTSFEGFEDEGTLGTIHLVLKERWELDRPW